MKVAFATTDGKQIDEHFGRAGMFAIYDVLETGFSFIELRTFAEGMDMAVVDTKDRGPLHTTRSRTRLIGLPTASSFISRRSAGLPRRGW